MPFISPRLGAWWRGSLISRDCFMGGNPTFRALLVRGLRRKWVYTLVVLRGSTVFHFRWAHGANALTSLDPTNWEGAGQSGGHWEEWKLLCRGCRLSTTKVNKQRKGLCAHSYTDLQLAWCESTLVSQTGGMEFGLSGWRRAAYFKHSAVRFLYFFSHPLHKMPGFRSSYFVQFKPGCSFGRTPDLQPLKSASSVH